MTSRSAIYVVTQDTHLLGYFHTRVAAEAWIYRTMTLQPQWKIDDHKIVVVEFLENVDVD